MDSISCKECKKCLFINTLQLIIQSSTKYNIMAKKKSAGCEYCSNYVYDEDYEYYVCDINLDEDEMARFMSYSDWDCPYFQMDDEYAIVRKQN